MLRDAAAVLLQQQGVYPAGGLHISHGALRAAQEVSGCAATLRRGRKAERTLSSAPVNPPTIFIMPPAYSYLMADLQVLSGSKVSGSKFRASIIKMMLEGKLHHYYRGQMAKRWWEGFREYEEISTHEKKNLLIN